MSKAEELKSQGNDAFRKGDIQNGIQFYTSALECINDLGATGGGHESSTMASTLLSNRAMCYLKAAESQSQTPNDIMRQSLRNCIDDCTSALERMDAITVSSSNTIRGKILYRRSKALVVLATLVQNNDVNGDDDDDTKENNLNRAAKDLLQLLSFDVDNKEAASLLRVARAHHGNLGGGMGRSRISRALDVLRRALACDENRLRDDASEGKGGESLSNLDALKSLRILQGSLAEDVSSSAEDIGRRGGVAPLLKIARHGILERAENPQHIEQCRVASLHVLSGCCSHEPFILKYGGRDSLAPAILAQIVEEEAVLSNTAKERGVSADVAVAAMALLVRLIVHWDHREVARFFASKIFPDGTMEETAIQSTVGEHVPEVDGSSVCRAAKAAFLWGSGDGGAKAPRAALDLVSAWTASDLDALDAASEACFRAPSSSSKRDVQKQKAAHHKLAAEDIRRMKPRQVAAHRKREVEYQRNNNRRAVQHISAFCSEEVGGLESMLSCAARAEDHRLRREVGLQIGRMMSAFEEDDVVKKLIFKALGCTNWKVGKEDEDGDESGGLSTLTIEELDEEKEMDDDDGKEEGSDEKLFAVMKRGQLAASLLVGRPDVGTWAFKFGWSDGNGVEELKELISSNDPCAMSIASELVSAASSVESSRPFLLPLVEEGTLEDLLIHPDADVRSGAASCAAKIGLASKALSADDGEVMELLDVAIELLFEENEDELGTEDGAESSSKTKSLFMTKEVPPKSVGDSTSMERGVEVMAYLVSKTFVKEKVSNAYKPKGSPANRKTALQRLVEIACAPERGDAQMAYGLAGIFNLLAVSVETLRKEAFIGKEITKEQYDQLQALGKTEEEKEAEAKVDEREGDSPALVSERIRKLASANVPRAMVKLLEGSSSDATQEKLLEGMGRMASEASVRGVMIQQGCLSTCLQLDKGNKPNEAEKKILRLARSCVAKMLVTINPGILTVSQRSGSVGPLLKLVKDSDALDLMHFEALMSLTNLAGFDNETKNRVVKQKGIPTLGYAMFSDHEMVRQAATEAMCNMIPHPEMMEYLTKEENLRVWIAFSLDYEENFACARAALGCLAMAVPDPEFAGALVKCQNFRELIRALMECGQLELMHRILVLIVGLIEHGGKCREAVIATGVGPFFQAYIQSYQDEKKTMNSFNFSPSEQGSLTATLSLAKEVVRLLM
eukprot:CAMPEP_0172540380 /NCGR_PEP_ID=MMETSP1067-20121228/11412_1 /TAXON_ID=265564 ORGANISM="Thalassiosira punctigera, Strain Tpunct2005C2" /NCGR_SAMPLE_ID=MMETSP1067 /ASSEMBLY_ACC=CAM_ASM_000444 /LENGTH=1190 /DNA_ID=CAMNT_0013326233 /DNA_START=169 /DNA_END=3741 /DNA_ORIENTATION=+